jgi:peptidoglycan/LPS O-acetylase OafA/YrhL
VIRSVLAILAGIATLTAASFAIELVVAIAYNGPARVFQITYTTLCIAAGGYVTARVARRRMALHAAIMGVIEVGLTVLAMRTFADKAPPGMWIASMIMTAPAAWLGGVIAAQQAARKVKHATPLPG